jgi:hypothetical protein
MLCRIGWALARAESAVGRSRAGFSLRPIEKEADMATVADVARQVLDLSKATFDNVFLTFDALQGALERTVLAAADQAAWVPGELKTVAHECVDLARRTRRDVKRTGDRCHQEFHAMVDRVLDDPPAAGTDPLPLRQTTPDRETAVVH